MVEGVLVQEAQSRGYSRSQMNECSVEDNDKRTTRCEDLVESHSDTAYNSFPIYLANNRPLEF